MAVLGLTASALAQQSANPDDARRWHADHDFTTTLGSSKTLDEWFVDVKTPGDTAFADSRSYVVGTAYVDDNTFVPTFSNAPIQLPTSVWSSFDTGAQVGIVQCRNASQGIVWQRYLYGRNVQDGPRWTNLRAVAVWPAETNTETRIVVCGETTDEEFPLAPTLMNATTTSATGFVAVYNGDGLLLWVQRFYGSDLNQTCTITDVTIHVEVDGQDTYDVVTYCGASTHGNPTGNTPLEPLYPFEAPIGDVGSGYTGADGDTTVLAGPWSGIVGRVRFDRGTSTISRDFHSIVGGAGVDALFGIALLNEDEFVVVGNTSLNTTVAVAESFPFNRPGVIDATGATTSDWNNTNGNTPQYSVGTLTVFDAAPTRTGSDLDLVDSFPLGHIGTVESVARDVWAAPIPEGYNMFVVGSTNDTPDTPAGMNRDFIESLDGGANRGAQGTHGGQVDGFLIQADYPALAMPVATYFGGAGDEGLTGVSGWNAAPFNCAVVGFVDNGATSGTDLVVASYWDVTETLVRSDVVGSSAGDTPTALGALQAMTGSRVYPTTPNLGEPAGGGISVDSVLRATVVGASPSLGATPSFPVVGGDGARGGIDAVRVVYDMLPQGVWRTDGTGTRAAAFGAVPQPSGYYGGTTPVACLSQFGQRPGGAPPELRRISIDYEGPTPAAGVSNAYVTLSDAWPTNSAQYILGLVRFGFPSGGPATLNGSQAEIWVDPNGSTPPSVLYAGNTILSWPIPTMPGGGAYEFTMQGIFLLPAPMTCDPTASPGTVASPGLVISY